MELSISGRSFRTQCTTYESPIGSRVVSVPPLLKGHSITVQFMVSGELDSFWVCFGTGEQVRSSPGIIASFTKTGGTMVHYRSSSPLIGRASPVVPRLVASFTQDISAVRCFWLVWREGLLFAGCGNVGEGLLMAADTAADDVSVALDAKSDRQSRYVTDDVAAIFVGSGEFPTFNSIPRKSQVSWDVVVRALWRNSACRYARALTTCDSSLPEASPRDRSGKDKLLGRRSVGLIVPHLPLDVSLAELAWWLRFAFRPRSGNLARKMETGTMEIGHNIDVENVRLVSGNIHSAGNVVAGNVYAASQLLPAVRTETSRKVALQLKVTREVLKSLLCTAHTIKTADTVISIVQE